MHREGQFHYLGDDGGCAAFDGVAKEFIGRVVIDQWAWSTYLAFGVSSCHEAVNAQEAWRGSGWACGWQKAIDLGFDPLSADILPNQEDMRPEIIFILFSSLAETQICPSGAAVELDPKTPGYGLQGVNPSRAKSSSKAR